MITPMFKASDGSLFEDELEAHRHEGALSVSAIDHLCMDVADDSSEAEVLTRLIKENTYAILDVLCQHIKVTEMAERAYSQNENSVVFNT